jgi:AI-2 transport protein TqsA
MELERRVQTIALVVLAAITAAAALHWLRPVMVPFVLALFISLGLNMAVEFGTARLRMPRGLALAVTLGLGLLFFGGVGLVVSASVTQITQNASDYSAQLAQLFERLLAALPEEVRVLGLRSELRSLTEIPVSTVGGFLADTTNAVLNLLSKSFLVLIFVLFLVIGAGPGRAEGTWGRVQLQVQRYLVQKAALSAVTGLLVGAALTLLGVPLAMAFGLLAFLLNFVPSVGSIVATLLPLPVVIVSPDVSTGTAVAAIAVPGAIQVTIGNFIEPKIMGDALDLHPVTILVSLIVWGMIWGVVGALLATPITAVLKILMDRFDGSRPVAELLAGRLARSALPAPRAAPDDEKETS